MKNECVRRIAAVNDLSGFGRCSLTVAMPVLSACGFQVCPAPTAVLSAHTGYEAPYILDLTRDLPAYLAHWEQLGLDFAGVYTGFLGSASQGECVGDFLRKYRQKGALCLVDPAMADHGKLYATCTPALVEAMKKLVAEATVITPNLTEACLLTGTDYAETAALTGRALIKQVEEIGKKLLSLGCASAVVTGIRIEDTVQNAVCSGEDAQWVGTAMVPCAFAGTGDVFSSVLCGALLNGCGLPEAVVTATDFVAEVAAFTVKQGGNEQDGLCFEPFLYKLTGDDRRG